MLLTEQFILPLIAQIMGKVAIAINKMLQIRQVLSSSKIKLYNRKNSAKTSKTTQTMSNCQSFFLSWIELSTQNVLDNIVNNFVINTLKLSTLSKNASVQI